MTGSELAVTLADNLAWPLVVLVVLAALGGPLRRLIAGPLTEAIRRMRTGSVRAAGLEVGFSAEGGEPEEAAAEALEDELRPQVGHEVTPELIERAVRSATEAVQEELQELRRTMHTLRELADSDAVIRLTTKADGDLVIEQRKELSPPERSQSQRRIGNLAPRRMVRPLQPPDTPVRQLRRDQDAAQVAAEAERTAAEALRTAARRRQDAAKANAISERANAMAAREEARAEKESARAGKAKAVADAAEERAAAAQRAAEREGPHREDPVHQ